MADEFPFSDRPELASLILNSQWFALLLEIVLFVAFFSSFLKTRGKIDRRTREPVHYDDDFDFEPRHVTNHGYVSTANTSMLVLSLAHLLVTVIFSLYLSVRADKSDLKSVVKYYHSSTAKRFGTAQISIYVTQQLTLDAFLLYRLYALWGYRRRAIVLPAAVCLVLAMYGYTAASRCGVRLCGAIEWGVFGALEIFFVLTSPIHILISGYIFTRLLYRAQETDARPWQASSTRLPEYTSAIWGSATPYALAMLLVLISIFHRGWEDLVYRVIFTSVPPILGFSFTRAVAETV